MAHTMQHLTDPQYYVIGYLTTGNAFYLSKHKASATNTLPRTGHKAHAWKLSFADAEETVARFHRVQALGYHHQDVLHYDVRQV